MTAARRVLAFLLGLVVCVLAATSAVAVWAHTELLDTDRYVAEVGPLSSEPAVQAEVSRRVTNSILTGFPVQARDGLRPVVSAQADLFVKSPAFAIVWTAANRTAHAGLVAVLRDQAPPGTAVRSGHLYVDLAPAVAAVVQQLAGTDVQFAQTSPRVALQLDVVDVHQLERARTVVRWLDRLWLALPIATIVLLAVVVALAKRRLRSAGWQLLGVALALGAVWLAVQVGAEAAAAAAPRRNADPDAVRAIYGRLTAVLREIGIWAAVVAGLGGLGAFGVGALESHRFARSQREVQAP